jgi:predicted phosphodiesterase
MRFLLISDTHGRLAVIDELADRVRADAVIHAGDFGFFDDRSFERLSDRELRLHIAHSDLPRIEKDRILTLSRDAMIKTAREHRLLGAFQSFLDGIESFHVPVYAVWGNHEDKDVVERLSRGDVAVRNLHILHHRQGYRVGRAFVFGLGGNVLPGSKMMQRPIAGGGGKIWSTLSQYSDIVETVERGADPTKVRIFVSHVSPGKEPFVELIGARTGADFTVSGHMGAPASMVWNPFAINTVEEAEKRLRDGFHAMKRLCLDTAEKDASCVAEAFDFIGRVPKDTIDLGRGVKAPRWYRRMTHINLPDAHVGYAVLDIDETGSKLQTFLR